MKRVSSLNDLRAALARYRRQDVGLVPTMGALHKGHFSLIDRCVRDCKVTVVSIFVNPLQFGPTEDLDHYPRPIEHDSACCEERGVDILFTPNAEDFVGTMEGAFVTEVIPPESMVRGLCAPWRPGHFEGVLTIVAKLLHSVQPQRAYFGQKDAQQLALIRRMVVDLNWPVRIVGGATVREADGLALSSRNQYLSAEERNVALALSRGLFSARDRFLAGERRADSVLDTAQTLYDGELGLKVQYLELVHPDTLQPITDQIEDNALLATAAMVGETRLIDNVMLELPRPPIVAIDGPAGAGKSTVARRIAATLELMYLDTGALYRAVTWLALDTETTVEDEEAIALLAESADIQLKLPEDISLPTRVWVNGREVTCEIRTREVTAQVSTVAAMPRVRKRLLRVQQQMGRGGGVVMEGRDIGTQVFPDAELKIFLTASVEERARRRMRDLQAAGTDIGMAALEQQIRERDRKDSEREVAPLRQAEDALELITDHLTQEQVVEKIVGLYRELDNRS